MTAAYIELSIVKGSAELCGTCGEEARFQLATVRDGVKKPLDGAYVCGVCNNIEVNDD